MWTWKRTPLHVPRYRGRNDNDTSEQRNNRTRKINNHSFSCAQVIVKPTDSRLSEKGILVVKSLVDVQMGELQLRLANMSDDPQKIYSDTLAAKCEPVEVITSDVRAHSQ